MIQVIRDIRRTVVDGKVNKRGQRFEEFLVTLKERLTKLQKEAQAENIAVGQEEGSVHAALDSLIGRADEWSLGRYFGRNRSCRTIGVL